MSLTRISVLDFIAKNDMTGVDFVFVVCDEFDYTDYMVYVKESEYDEKYRYYNDRNKMSSIMDIFDLRKPKQSIIAPKYEPSQTGIQFSSVRSNNSYNLRQLPRVDYSKMF